MWNEIRDESDITSFMDKHYHFHDSCIKELKYVSGAYATDTGLYPLNDQRILKVIAQGRFEGSNVIEMEFAGLKRLSLLPADEKYDCIIFEATMFFRDSCIYWCNWNLSEGELSNPEEIMIKPQHLPLNYYEDDSNGYSMTLICASKVRWRTADEYNGKDEIYSAR
ncbi:MAG: hypothetical protein FWC54_04690 [Actinomycetia bacterium]|nr:hypothetical protein [Actinomycetes bacterium]